MKKEIEKMFADQETMVAELMDSFGFGKAFLGTSSKDLIMIGKLLDSYKKLKESAINLAEEEDNYRASTTASLQLLTKMVGELRADLLEVNARLKSLNPAAGLAKEEKYAKAREEIPTYKMSEFEALSDPS